ncbi:MAG TPA: peptidyl-prolyl cis-trans isomerase [Gemmataceae bacterium]|nr:peptidyl-prolyl cis-trans isomerase [Gemmataceae bacterium]
MSWRDQLAAVWVMIALTVCGCFSKNSTLADLPPIPVPPTTATRSAGGPETVRAQKPEMASPRNDAVCRLISLPVELPAEASHAHPTATIRAVVNGELILDEELRIACMRDLMTARTPKEQQEVLKKGLEDLINREVLLQDAISKLKRGGKQGEAFLKKIHEIADEEFDKHWLRPMLKEKKLASRQDLADVMQQSGLSLEVMRRWWERNYMAQQYLSSRIEAHMNSIGHREISEYYDSHRDEYSQPDSVDWQDIFLDVSRHASPAAARQFAESLVQRVRQGEDFAELSHEYDNGESGRFRKGAGHGHRRGDIFPPEAEPILFQMHDGDVRIVDCQRPRGIHVIRLVKRQYAGPIPFDAKVQKEIHDKLRMIVFKREKESIVKDLKRRAIIDRCDGPN